MADFMKKLKNKESTGSSAITEVNAVGRKSIEQTNAELVSLINLDEIDENPENEKIFNMDDVDSLAEEIKENGFDGAIIVFKKSDGRYEISSGHRRYRAMKKIGEKSIRCIVYDMPDERTKNIRLLSSNIKNRKLKPMDYARAIEKYYSIIEKEPGNKRELVARFFNISETQVHRYRCLNKLIPELQELANSPDFPFAGFAKVAEMEKDEQKKYYKLIKTHESLSRSELEKMTDMADEVILEKKHYNSTTNKKFSSITKRLKKLVAEADLKNADIPALKKELSTIRSVIDTLEKKL